MGLLHLFISALAASAAMAADPPCGCVNPDQKLNPISNPLLFFQQPTIGGAPNGVACPMNCTLTAHAFDEATEGLVIQILTNALNNAKITVVDGPRTFLITKNTVQADIKWKSTGGVLIFNFEGEVSPAGSFMLVVQKSDTRDPIPIQISSTAAPPTPPYDNLKYNNNPLLVADDIMIGIDLSSDDLDDLKSFASDLITALTITNATDCGAGTRLALHGLTNFKGFSPTYFPDWQYQTDIALGHIGAMSQIGSGPFYIEPVETFVENGFKLKTDAATDKETDRCLNRGRVYILLTTSQPADYIPNPPTSDPIVNFLERGVHPIIVTPLKEGKRPYYDQYATKPDGSEGNNRWAYFNIDDGVTKFINNYLVYTIPDLSCQLPNESKITLTTTTTIALPEKVSIPPYYAGMKPTGTEADWETIKHYCNFQSTTVSIEQSKDVGKIPTNENVCLKVFYDLETDKDYVSIYSGDLIIGDQKEVVRLTGRDVSGTTFRLGKKVGSIVFSSDEKNVFDGFYAEVYPCG